MCLKHSLIGYILHELYRETDVRCNQLENLSNTTNFQGHFLHDTC